MDKIIPILLIMILASPVYIVIRYLGWCCKQDREDATAEEQETTL
mgnify:CR=1 FL=1